jgi:hypothetical protein
VRHQRLNCAHEAGSGHLGLLLRKRTLSLCLILFSLRRTLQGTPPTFFTRVELGDAEDYSEYA